MSKLFSISQDTCCIESLSLITENNHRKQLQRICRSSCGFYCLYSTMITRHSRFSSLPSFHILCLELLEVLKTYQFLFCSQETKQHLKLHFTQLPSIQVILCNFLTALGSVWGQTIDLIKHNQLWIQSCGLL